MKAALLVIAVTVAALAFVGAVVGPGGDSTILVPPPEAVAESFMHQVQAGRYERAVQYLDPSSGVSEATIRISAEALTRSRGDIELLEGEQSQITGDKATAIVKLTMRGGAVVRPSFSLVRRSGEWRIIDWTQP